jgi:hypothetical protein
VRRLTKSSLTIIIGILLWGVAIGLGLRALLAYENTPGAAGRAPRKWPAGTTLHLSADGDTLLMFAHPRCPCTLASVEELSRLVAHCEGKLRGSILLWKPNGSAADWEKTSLAENAARIPGMTVLPDLEGVEARRFGAETSGDVMLFDAKGHLLFHGGITGSRGHAGDNAGAQTIIALVRGESAPAHSSFVFGCSLSGRACPKQPRL